MGALSARELGYMGTDYAGFYGKWAAMSVSIGPNGQPAMLES